MKSTAVVSLCLAALSLSCAPKSSVPTLPTKVVGSCVYVNKFSSGNECREYRGEWTEADAAKDCEGQKSTLIPTTPCDDATSRSGYCILGGPSNFTRITMYSEDAKKCGSAKQGCELFGGGTFDPSPLCGGDLSTGGTGLPTFQQPNLVCKDPLPGEPVGQSAGGKVCTWEMISGATEPGRHFEDYASCDRVRTQRPYYPVDTAKNATVDDPRMSDPVYTTELNWLKSQVNSAACVCCHKSTAPKGPSNWYVDQPGNFMNGFYARGLAMGAGWINTVGFGAYPKEQNNGFSRADLQNPNDSIFPTTDKARLMKFFEDELAHRGLKRSDFTEQYGAGPLDDQRFYVPTACADGESIAADGTLTWSGGPARYVYVLEEGTTPPTVPPNLDLPAGTLWRIDAVGDGAPAESGKVKFGQLPAGMVQKYPASGSPAALTSGKKYLLYVLQDIIVPVARCVTTAP